MRVLSLSSSSRTTGKMEDCRMRSLRAGCCICRLSAKAEFLCFGFFTAIGPYFHGPGDPGHANRVP